MIATAFAPGSIGNVGPGFDVLGLAVEGIGDRVTVELTSHDSRITGVTGRDACLIPREASRNAAAIAAIAWLRANGREENVIVSIDKGLALSGGMGGSAASAVAGAYAAALCVATAILPASALSVITAALEAESLVAGRHLDNIASSVLGGLTISRSIDPIDAISVKVAAPWWVALVTPDVRIETKAARAILPEEWPRAMWVQQMANTAALTHAFAAGDGALVARSLDDRYAEPLRANLILHCRDVKRAAVLAGAFGCGISGSGPTMFAICENASVARAACTAMQNAFGDLRSSAYAGPIANEGVRAV
ncbi:MAG TPA: homoserine kinase [Thermoanaerobaculia bacterium]|jgi:homoserine kinase